ncbi:MAG: hypothetical protein CMH57_12680 [Myxococcales bacterium]|nr:hypothetical protein [Myxococcales bacterium]
METTPKVLLVDPNPTVLQCATRALRSLDVEVLAQAAMPDDAEERSDLDLLVIDCGRVDDATVERLEAWLDQERLPPILPLSPQPERLPEELLTHPRYVRTLEKPFTPSELCTLALRLNPALNPDLDPDQFAFQENLKPLSDAIELDMDIEDDEGSVADEGDLGPVLAVLEDLNPEDAAPGDYMLSEHMADDSSLDELDLEVSGITPLEDQSVDSSWSSSGAIPVVTPSAASSDAFLEVSDDDMLAFDEDDLIEELDGAELLSLEEEPSPHDVVSDAELIEVGEDAILEVVESPPPAAEQPPPLPRWAVLLDQHWAALSLETSGYHRASLLASLLAREGMPADPYWTQPAVADRCEQRLDALASLNGFHGMLAQLRPMVLLRLIRERQFTGSLELYNGAEAYRLTLWGDTLRFLEPRQLNQELLLGRILVARGWLDVDALHAAMEAQRLAWTQGRRVPLGRHLVEQEQISAEQLEDALKVQARGYFFEICNMRAGTFIFREEQPGLVHPFGPFEPVPLNFQVTHLLLEMLRDSSMAMENSGVRVVDQQDTTRLVVNPSAPRHLDDELTSSEREVLDLFSTQRVTRDLPEVDSGEDIDRVIRRLHRLGLLDQV